MVQQLSPPVSEEAVVPTPAADADFTLPGLIRVPPPEGSAFTDEHLEQIDADNPGWKFELDCDGELVINMGSGGVTSDIESEINGQIRNWRVAGGGGRIRTSSGGYWLGGEPRRPPEMEPDTSWLSDQQVANLSPEQRPSRGYWTVCPAFVIEIRSPSDSLASQKTKMSLWMQLGVQLGWLVDPIEQTVWIYRLNQGPEQLERPATLSGEDVLQGLEVDMTEVWAFSNEVAAESGS